MLLSVIITSHNEGLLLHKTILSLRDALAFLDEKKYEVILHIDNGSKETLKYVERGTSPLKLKVFHNNFGDLGLSRNYCINQAKGKYVFFIDADDLISNNFLEVALKQLKESKEEVLVHQEACLSFEEQGIHSVLWIMDNGEKTEKDIYPLFEKNLWISSVIGKRETFLHFPYQEAKNGFGNEDYIFNIETINAGIKHVVAPNTVHFYRKRRASMLAGTRASYCTQHYSDLFSFENWKNYQVVEEKVAKNSNSLLKRGTKKVLRKAASLAGINSVASDLPTVEDFVIDAWKNINKIETQLYPTNNALRNMVVYKPRENCAASAAFATICKNTIQKPDIVFVAPWISAGGADKVLINYLKAIQELWPDKKACVITTKLAKNEWKDKLPNNTTFIDFGNIAAGLDSIPKEMLFTRLLIQLACKDIHIINSEYAFKWVDEHKELVKHNFNLCISLFCYDIIPGTNNQGVFDYADPYTLNIYDLVDKIYTDNTITIQRLNEKYGFEKNKMVAIFQPSGYTITSHETKEKAGFKVLWASRICPQKNPELLPKIADILAEKDNDIAIDVYGRFDEDYNYTEKLFSGHKNLTYRGSFNGLGSIELSNYDCILYTSLIDGLPNIILEAAACGLPIIASNDGGVSDFIKNKDTGLLVNDINNADQYVEQIIFAKEHLDKMKTYSDNAQKLLKTQHDWKVFLNSISKNMRIDK